MPSQLGTFFFVNEVWITSLGKIKGFNNKSKYYRDADRLYMGKKLGCVR